MINVVLYEPSIPGNTGNIMRTCVAASINLHLIKPLGFKLDQKSIRRSGVNYVNSCNYFVYENIEDFFKKNAGTYYFSTRYGSKAHSQYDFTDKKEAIYFIFGNEQSGIPKNILLTHINNCMRIPMSDKVRTLNLSNTVAIVVYEALRQREYESLYLNEPHKSPSYITE